MSDRILIVDDDDNIQILLARLLTLEGIENVDVVSSGLEAIEYLASMRPSLVLLDVNMPGLDGWLVCEIINNVKRWKSIPVVFQTALQGSEKYQAGRRTWCPLLPRKAIYARKRPTSPRCRAQSKPSDGPERRTGPANDPA